MGSLAAPSLPAQLSQLHVSGKQATEVPSHPREVNKDSVDISNLLTRFLKYEGLSTPEPTVVQKNDLILS